MIRRINFSILFFFFGFALAVQAVELNENHPQSYTVVKGDTLWDISGTFLKYPWHWPEIWSVNPQIENPHLIYPGDLLWLADCDGKPCLKLTRGSRNGKLSPEMREIEFDAAITTIPLSAIGPFLSRPRVVGDEVLDSAPYVVAGSEERLISGAGDQVYARGVDAENGKHYNIFREGPVYKDPETEEILGFEAIYLADAWIKKMGDPATVDLRTTSREVMIGDRLLEIDDTNFDLNFIPRQPTHEVDGIILSVFDGVSQVGQYQVVVLNRGERDNLEVGHVVSIWQTGDTVRDIILSGVQEEDFFNLKNREHKNEVVTLPDENAGVAMIFKTYEKVSYAIVMKATRAIHIGDKISDIE
ncbi:MAG: LysM peptidoglycan-binding domain-containing protein [Methylophagaceae bacterium]